MYTLHSPVREVEWNGWDKLGKWHIQIRFHRETMGLEGGFSSPGVEGQNYGGGWWNLREQFQMCAPNIWEGYFAGCEQNSHPKCLVRTRFGGHSCRRWGQARVQMLRHVLSLGSCSHFRLILQPHRVAVPFPPTFTSPWLNSFVQIHGGTKFFEGKFWDYPSKTTKKDQNRGVGSSHGTNNPPPPNPSFPCEISGVNSRRLD